MIPRSAETRISGILPNLLPSVLFRYFFLEKFLLFIVGKSLEPFRRLLTQLIGVKQIGKTKDWKSRRNRKSFLSRWHRGATMWILSYADKIVIPTMIQNTYTTCRNAELIQTTKLFRLLKFFDFANTTTSVLSFKNESAEKGKENLTAKPHF